MKFRPRHIAGFALISADGMIAEPDRSFPPAIVNEADYKFFHDSLGEVDACIHGQLSHEGGPDADKRARIVLTRRVAALAPNPEYPRSLLWNPDGATFEQAWSMLGIGNGSVAVIGGTEVFGMFLEIGYDAFNLSRAGKALVPGGRPVFPEVPEQTPEQVLARFKLSPGPRRILDQAADVSVVTWAR